MNVATVNDCVFEPLWARLYLTYKRKIPNHRGKGRILRALHAVGVRKRQPFLWRMNNGSWVAISPGEGYAPWSVGWTCFETRQWEPHIEKFLSRRIQAGQQLFDIGANLGYFSAVMARLTGPSGKLWSFEPVPATFRQLSLCQRINGFSQMTPICCALGAEAGKATIHFNPAVMGSASIHHFGVDDKESVEVSVCKLDELWNNGQVGTPQLVKIDVEGHEYAALQGGRELLTAAKPDIIFELNEGAATSAGWNLNMLATFLQSCGNYKIWRIGEDGLEAIDVERFQPAKNQYLDMFASVHSQTNA